MMELARDKQVLLDLGFVDIGKWTAEGDVLTYSLEGRDISTLAALLDTPNALYAFVQGDVVLYIGKTSRSIKRRFTGYCRPGSSQRTNIRCNANIKKQLSQGIVTRILVFTPLNQLQYSGFEINLAAALEDSLIRDFNPIWNGRQRNRAVSEDAERETELELLAAQPDDASINESLEIPPFDEEMFEEFTIELHSTYYEKGVINLGVNASRNFGGDGEPVLIEFSNGDQPINSTINRTANPNKTVRLIGNNSQIAKWFQDHFSKGQIVRAIVVDPHRVRLFAP
jgi:hypothetical protein